MFFLYVESIGLSIMSVKISGMDFMFIYCAHMKLCCFQTQEGECVRESAR